MLQELLLVLLWNISLFRSVFKRISLWSLCLPSYTSSLAYWRLLNPSGVLWGFMPLLLNGRSVKETMYCRFLSQADLSCFHPVPKSLNSSVTFTHAVVPIPGLLPGPSSSKQGQLLATAGFWLPGSSVLLPGSVAKVEPCLVVAVPATSCSWLADTCQRSCIE